LKVLCDLDGVVYRGSEVLPNSAEALRRLISSDVGIVYITNNSTRSPEMTAQKITDVADVPVDPDQVVSSPLAATALLEAGDGPVYVVGEEGIRDAVARVGLETTEQSSEARTVMVGLTRSITYEMLAAATSALRSGARFVATNNDPTFPTETGLAPGAGAIVAALSAASGRSPEVAGKPHSPMRETIRAKGVGDAFVIGDRLDTDIALAREEADWRSILVLTGVTTRAEAEGCDADHVVTDLAAAVDLVLGTGPRS
jgi:4-nitrophenyl phosphatase